MDDFDEMMEQVLKQEMDARKHWDDENDRQE
jgi:hypothetical protein